jgi:hypothetical protein
MATAIFVAGPTSIFVNVGAGFVELGQTDNDSLPQVTYSDNIHEIKTVSSGATPEEMVVQNTSATITVTLVKWDAAVLTSLQTRQRGAAFSSTVGRLLVADSGTFGVKIAPATVNKTGYTFGRCFVIGEGFAHSQFGNVEQRMGLTFRAIPDGSNLLAASYTT